MTIARWTPPVAPTRQEQFMLKRLGRVRKLLGFLRLHRHELFDDAFQDELAAMYRTHGRRERGASARDDGHGDARAGLSGDVRRRDDRVDRRRSAGADGPGVPGCRGAAVFARRVAGVSRTADRRRPGSPRAGTHRRVGEAHARRSTLASCPRPCAWRSIRVRWRARAASRTPSTCWPMRRATWCSCAAGLLGWTDEQVCREAGIPLLVESSIKRALDIDWNDAVEKAEAITTLLAATRRAAGVDRAPPARGTREAAAQGRTSRPWCRSGRRIWSPIPRAVARAFATGVAADRRVSIADPEMRHGRKSKSKRFNGFKRHIAADVDRGLILACAITPANRPEDGGDAVLDDRPGSARDLDVDHLLIDRGYINSTLVDDVLSRRGKIVCKPWKSHNGRLFPKSAFTLNLRDRTIACPNGQVQPLLVRHRRRVRSRRLRSLCPCARNAPPPNSATGARSPSRRTSRCSSGSASRSRPPRDAPRCGSAR